MQRIFLFSFLLVIACKNKETEYVRAENAFDAGREFIDGTLKGDFKKAAFYMLPDSGNLVFLNLLEKDFRLKDKEARQQFRTASINIQQVEDLDSVTSIIHYNNSYDKIKQAVKVVKQNNFWLVDYKYSYQNKN